MDLTHLEAALVNQPGHDASLDPANSATVHPYQARSRMLGLDMPAEALTMVGLIRLRNVRSLIESAVRAGVPGDVLEAGVWRGGAAMYMRAVLDSLGASGRRVFAADSFRGFPALPGFDPARYPHFAVPLDVVRANFARHHLLDDRTVFLGGWFKETLPDSGIDRLAVLRIDATLPQSTAEVLNLMYEKVSPGGYIIVDGYGSQPGIRQGVDEFRRRAWISAPLRDIDGIGVYWRMPGEPEEVSEAAPGVVPRLAPRTEPGPLLSVIAADVSGLQSVLRQDPIPGELFLLGTPDQTVPKDRVKVLADRSLNAATAASSGQWVHVLAEGDVVLDGFYRTMAERAALVPGSVGVLCCRAALALCDRPGVLANWLETLSYSHPVNPSAWLVRRQVYETVGLYDETLGCPAWEFALRSAVRYDWWYEPQPLLGERTYPKPDLTAARCRQIFERAQVPVQPHADLTAVLAVRAFEGGDLDAAADLQAQSIALRPCWA